MANYEFDVIPDDQQESEDDIVKQVSFKDAVFLSTDWTIETLHSQIKKGNIDLQPGFQRRVAWDDVRKSRLLESIIVGMPVPNIVLAENREHRGRLIVIDGKQRLASTSEFLDGRYKLRGLDIRKDLNNKSFDELPQEDREYLENATLRSSVIRNWNDENFLYAIFFRLNSGSLPLSPQELRKALVGGNLIDAIESYLLGSDPFKSLFGDGLDKRMRDSELVLRFLAFDRELNEYRGDFRVFLDDAARYFESDWESRRVEAEALFSRLDGALTVAQAIFGHDAFKKWLGDKYERVINRAIFDCLIRFFADSNIAAAVQGREADVVNAFKELCGNREFRDSVEKTTKSVPATFLRIDRWGASLATCLGLSYDAAARRIV